MDFDGTTYYVSVLTHQLTRGLRQAPLHQRKGFLVTKPDRKSRFPYTFSCRKVQVSSVRKLNGKMLFSRLELAETSTTTALPPTDLTSVRNDGGKEKPCLVGRTSQDLSIPQPQPPWKRSWKRDCTFPVGFPIQECIGNFVFHAVSSSLGKMFRNFGFLRSFRFIFKANIKAVVFVLFASMHH